jgi:hypothetical protein
MWYNFGPTPLRIAMLTRLLQTVVSFVAFVVTAPGALPIQDSPEKLILERAVAASRKAEPGWRFITATLNAPPLMDEQLGAASGSWYKSSDDSTGSWYRSLDESTRVGVTIYTIATTDAADRWLYRHAHGGAAKGWTVVTYEFGDGATMATYPDPRGFTQYQTTIRKGRFLVVLSGRSQETIERFANVLIAAISN